MTAPTPKKILLIGLHPDCVDYEKWPQLTPEKLEMALEDVISQLKKEGYRGVWCLTDQGISAADQVEKSLKDENPDIVLVGAGVRNDPDLLILFEKVINAIHEHAPRASIAFNSLPYDSVEAIKRWS